MPAPNPWLITDLTPEVIKALDGSIQTGLGRDGSRELSLAAPTAPEFTFSKTDTSITAIITNANGATSYEASIDGAAWFAGLTVSGLIAETPYPFQIRGINSTGTGAASTAVSVTTNAAYSPVGLIFSENFNDQPDWEAQSGMGIPVNWHRTYERSTWSPAMGHPDRHNVIEITDATIAENPNRARGGTGKSYVKWRDSEQGGDQWNTDSIMFYRIPGAGVRNIYVEFWINFSNEMVATYYMSTHALGQNKMFRVMSHDFPDREELTDYFSFFGSNHKPMFLWDMEQNQYGFRNKMSIYREKNSGDPDIGETVIDFPSHVGGGDFPMSYAPASMTGAAIGGGNTILPDIKNGGNITGSPVAIDQVFGDETHWTKMGFYLQMNSAPGVADGRLQQFVDDQRTLNASGIAWQTSVQPADKLWNLVGIGGNDYFWYYENSVRHEEWYAIDDIIIRDSLPEHLL